MSSVAILWHAWIQFSGGVLSPAVWRSVLSVAFLATFAWTSSEALRYYGLMRRRFALGLADAVVVNRFLIWGGGAAISTALTVAPVQAICECKIVGDRK